MSQEETDYAWLDEGLFARFKRGKQESFRVYLNDDSKANIKNRFTAQAKQHQVELVLARIDEIYKLKRSGVTDAIGLYAYQVDKLDFDNRIKQLQAKLAKLENKQ